MKKLIFIITLFLLIGISFLTGLYNGARIEKKKSHLEYVYLFCGNINGIDTILYMGTYKQSMDIDSMYRISIDTFIYTPLEFKK